MTTALLERALPETRAAFDQLGQLAADAGISFAFADKQYAGVRTEADTTAILRARQDDYSAYLRAFKRTHPNGTPLSIFQAWDGGKPRPIAPWGSSFHDFGAAFDIVPVSWPKGLTYDSAAAKLGALAPQVGLRWGGTWPGNKVDPRHFELAISLADAKARWEAFTGDQGDGSSSSSAGVVAGMLVAAALVGLGIYHAVHGGGWRSVT